MWWLIVSVRNVCGGAIVRERNVCVCVLCMCLAGIQKELPESIVPFNAGGPRCDIIYITDIYVGREG